LHTGHLSCLRIDLLHVFLLVTLLASHSTADTQLWGLRECKPANWFSMYSDASLFWGSSRALLLTDCSNWDHFPEPSISIFIQVCESSKIWGTQQSTILSQPNQF
jgi:hypothetical protein